MKVAALFAGCGGDSFGFSKAGFEIVFANDIDVSACYTFKEKFEKKSKKKIVRMGDIKNIYDFGSPTVPRSLSDESLNEFGIALPNFMNILSAVGVV